MKDNGSRYACLSRSMRGLSNIYLSFSFREDSLQLNFFDLLTPNRPFILTFRLKLLISYRDASIRKQNIGSSASGLSDKIGVVLF